MLAPLQRSAPTCFSWLTIPDYVPVEDDSSTDINTIQPGPLLVLLNYYSAVASFNLAPVIHKAFNKNAQQPGITHAEVPRHCWRPVWDSATSSFDIQKVGNHEDHSFWRWIGCQLFAGQQALYGQLSKCVLADSGFSPIPLFGAPTGHRFFSFASTIATSSPPLDPVAFFAQNADLIGHLNNIRWTATRAFHDTYKELPTTREPHRPVRLGPNGSHLEARLDKRPAGDVFSDIHLLLKELAQNQESLKAVVSLCSGDQNPYSARTALAEAANKLLELVEPMLTHTLFMAPGRFRRGHHPSAIPTAFPVSLHGEVSFQQVHKKPNLLFSFTPKDTPKISKPNLSVEEGSDENEVAKKQNTQAYFASEEGGLRALTVPLTQWQNLVQNDYGYERIFKEGKIHEFKKWNRLWSTLDGWYDLHGLKEGEDLTNIGFDSTLYFFPPEPTIDVLYKSYQLAIKTVQKKQGPVEEALARLHHTGRDIQDKNLLQDMVAKPAGAPSGMDTHALLKANQTAPDTTAHEDMVATVLFHEQMNCFGLLKEQILGGEGESADHFGLNTHQRLFCHHALNGDTTEGISPLIALNGPPGTGKTTVLQAVVASEVVRAALTQQAMPIIIGASATHQAKSNIIGGFQHDVVHPDGSSAQGIWKRWLKPLPSKKDNNNTYPAVSQFDYGLELSQQGTLSERLSRLHEHRKSFSAHWLQCFQTALSQPLESPSQNALRVRLNALFQDRHQPQFVPTHLMTTTNQPLTVLHGALQQWWQAAKAHERQAGVMVHQAHLAATAFDGMVSDLSTQWQALDACSQHLATHALQAWMTDPSALSMNIPRELDPAGVQLQQEKEHLVKRQDSLFALMEGLKQAEATLASDMEAWNKKVLADWEDEVNAEWDAIADGYNRCFSFCPSFLTSVLWRMKTSALKDLIKKATKQITSKEVKQQRRKAYWEHLVALQKSKEKAHPFEIPAVVAGSAPLPPALVKEKQALEQRQQENHEQQCQAEALNNELQSMEQGLQEAWDALETHWQQQEAILNQIASFFLAPTPLSSIEHILQAVHQVTRHGSLDQRKLQACLATVTGAGEGSLLSHAFAAISQGTPQQRTAASVADDIANVLGAWVDNAYKPTCFHLAARWNEGKALEEIGLAKSFTKLPNQEELTYRLQVLARVYPIMVSTLHAIGNRMAIKENGESLTGIGTIDLLVVDEAGQVPMTLGGLGLLLTKRCLAVGDRDQLEPIWEIEAEDDTALFKTLAHIPKDALSPAEFALMGWDCHAGSLLTLVQGYTPWSPYHGTLQRGLYLLEHNRCPIEIISYCDALSYQGQLRCKITSHYVRDNQAAYGPLLHHPHAPWGGRLIDKMSLLKCQNRPLNPGNPLSHPISLIEHDHPDVANGSRTNEGEAIAILEWLDKNFEVLTKGRGKDGADAPIADRVAIITPFTAQAKMIFAQAKAFEWKHSRLQTAQREQLFNADRKAKTTTGPNKTITIGTVHSLQGAEVDIVLFSNVYGEGSAGNLTFQDRNPQIMNVAVSRAKQAFVLFGNRHFIAGIKTDQVSAMGLLVDQIRMLQNGQTP